MFIAAVRLTSFCNKTSHEISDQGHNLTTGKGFFRDIFCKPCTMEHCQIEEVVDLLRLTKYDSWIH